jgi:hypothetical protein
VPTYTHLAPQMEVANSFSDVSRHWAVFPTCVKDQERSAQQGVGLGQHGSRRSQRQRARAAGAAGGPAGRPQAEMMAQHCCDGGGAVVVPCLGRRASGHPLLLCASAL